LKEQDMHHRDGNPSDRQDIAAAITIRTLGDEDGGRAAWLAQLDSARVPEGALLGVEVEGRLLAAISLATGEVIADPFSRTAELRALLELRAAQVRRRQQPARGRRRLTLRAQPSRAALAGSPPGAGGRLLTLRPPPLF
jgi:hypothetical protein